MDGWGWEKEGGGGRTSQPIGDLRVLDSSSSSFQSRFATSALSLVMLC